MATMSASPDAMTASAWCASAGRGKFRLHLRRIGTQPFGSSFILSQSRLLISNFDGRRNRQVRRLCATENAIDVHTASHSALAIQPEGFSAS
jgi:hypothetical protein